VRVLRVVALTALLLVLGALAGFVGALLWPHRVPAGAEVS
jgi:hypothetical protein